MEDRELENICKSSIYSKVGGRTRDSIFLEEIYPSGKEFEEFQPPAVCRFNRGGCRFNETIESRFSAEKWATREDEKFTRSRMPPPIPLLDKFSFSFFFQRVTSSSLSQGSSTRRSIILVFLIHSSILVPILLQLFSYLFRSLDLVSLLSFPLFVQGSYSSLHAADEVNLFLLEITKDRRREIDPDYPIE